MAWLFLLAVIVAFAYTNWHDNEESLDRELKYYLIFLFCVVFWGAVLRSKNDEFRLNVVLVSISLMVGVYLVEIVLYMIYPEVDLTGNSRLLRAKQSGVFHYDTRDKYEVYKDLIKEGVDAVPSIHPHLWIKTNGMPKGDAKALYPLGGVSNKTVVYCNESGKFTIFESDRYGFNNPDLEWAAEKTDWILVGDSFTEGACVKPGEGIAGQIRQQTGNSVINLGSSGNGPLLQLAGLKEYAQTRTPRIVLWFYYEMNDLKDDLVAEKSSFLLRQYLRTEFSQDLLNRQAEIDASLNAYIPLAEKEREARGKTERIIFWTRILRLYHIRQRIGFNDLTVDPLFAKILTKARDRVAAWNGKLYLVYLPEFSRYAKASINHGDFRKRNEVLRVVESLGIPVIDIHQEVFANHPDPLTLFPFRIYGHYNAEGYTRVASAIVESVKKSRGQLQ
jgi:hypothetical protein